MFLQLQPFLCEVRPCMPQQFVEQLYKCKPVQVQSKDFCKFKRRLIFNHNCSKSNSKNSIGIQCWLRRVCKNIFKSTIILLFRWSHFSKCGRSQILPQPSQELVRLSRCGRRSGNYDYQY